MLRRIVTAGLANRVRLWLGVASVGGETLKRFPTPIRCALLLGMLTSLAFAIVIGLSAIAEQAIRERREAIWWESVNEVLVGAAPDDNLSYDPIEVPVRAGSRDSKTTRVVRARSKDRIVAAAVPVTAPAGYGGPIRLLVGVLSNGQILGVTVLSHQETPGLGDPIDRRVSPWLHQFDRRSLANPSSDRWSVRRSGGEFDQLTGATITSLAVIGAVGQALSLVESQREIIYGAR